MAEKNKINDESNTKEDVLSKFDLEQYISRYENDSETRLQRLLFIAKTTTGNNQNDSRLYNSSLALNAYQLAVNHIKSHGNLTSYLELFNESDMDNIDSMEECIDPVNRSSRTETATSIPQSVISSILFRANIHYDSAWVMETKKTQQIQLETLESRLSSAQAHLNKDAIRTASIALYQYHLRSGNLKLALRYLVRARDYCTGNSQIVSLCLDVASLGIDMNDWSMVDVCMKQAETTMSAGIENSNSSTMIGDENSPERQSSQMNFGNGSITLAKIHCVTALAHLNAGEYSSAALKFASLSPEFTNQFTNVIASEDIALYGSILGLASLSSHTLRTMMIESNMFQLRLESLPEIREALRFFQLAEYGKGLQLLHSMKYEMYLDIHLNPHVDILFSKIKERCIVQYFYPFSRVSLETMGKSFFMTSDQVEEVVEKLILEGKIQGARINAKNGTLTRFDSLGGKRALLMKKVKKMGDQFIGDVESMILREFIPTFDLINVFSNSNSNILYFSYIRFVLFGTRSGCTSR